MKGTPIPMCGVPWHSSENYIARLIQKGYRVAVCEQTEDPRFTKKLVKREMLRSMKPGSVFVDIAIDQGGCAETSHPTTHDDPTFIEENVTHYCVANMPAAYARTATQALTNVTFRYIGALADFGLEGACERHPELISSINIMDGSLASLPVAAGAVPDDGERTVAADAGARRSNRRTPRLRERPG